MSGVSWAVIIFGVLICSDCLWRTVRVFRMPSAERWLGCAMAGATAVQCGIFGWLFWASLQ